MNRRFSRLPTPLAVALVVATCGCGAVAIRVENVSPLEFTQVTIAGEPCEDLAPGEISEYKSVRLKFRYAVVRMTINGLDVNAQSLNFGSKKFTHRIGIKDLQARHLDVELVRD